MSDDGATFLERWSKRKAQARGGLPTAEDGKETLTPPPTAREEGQEIPLEDLPPIETINATTDLTPWLRRKVPEAWKRAALGRVWSADPAISQFVGLADYDWDWNAPDGVPGFGPLRAADDVGQLLAQAIGQAPRKDKPETGEITAILETPPAGDIPSESTSPQLPKKTADAALLDESLSLQHQSSTEDDGSPTVEPHAVRRRRGGGALPS